MRFIRRSSRLFLPDNQGSTLVQNFTPEFHSAFEDFIGSIRKPLRLVTCLFSYSLDSMHFMGYTCHGMGVGTAVWW